MIEEKLKKFSEAFGIKMIVIFGSAAKKQKRPEDFDIALFMSDKERVKRETDMNNYSKLWLSLAHSLNVSADRLDITFVSFKTPPLFLYQIAKDGQLLFGERSDFLLFQLKAMKIFFDTAPFRKATTEYLNKFIHAR